MNHNLTEETAMKGEKGEYSESFIKVQCAMQIDRYTDEDIHILDGL